MARQQGLTLFELLVTLAIASFGLLISANAFQAYAPRIAVENAAEQLVADLKRARLHAQEKGQSVAVTPLADGYEIAALGVRRNLRNDIDVVWRAEDAGPVTFSHRFANLGGRIEIKKGRRRAVVLVHPITGKVERIE